MSYVDVGKDAKRKGIRHPRDERKIDPEPLRSTPSAKPHRKARKPFGMRYDKTAFKFVRVPERRYYALHFDWETCTEWFETARSRDQAMSAWRKKHAADPKNYRNIEPVSAETVNAVTREA